MKYYKLLFIVSFIASLGILTYRVTHGLFSDTASSASNTFTASAEFPTLPPSITPTEAVTPTVTVTPTPTGTQPGDVVINELMWMGSTKGTSDEWIELKNTTGNTIDISGWQITKWVTSGTDHEELMLTIPASQTIAAGDFYLIAQSPSGDPGSALNVGPNFTTTNVGLDNTDLQVRLFVSNWDTGGSLIDSAGDKGTPLKGEHETSTPKKFYSMERNDTPGNGTLITNWHTATASVGFDPGEDVENRGTPKTANSAP